MQAPGTTWPRRALVGLWVALFALLGSTVSSSWERLMSRLSSAPTPASTGPASAITLPTPTPGEQVLAEARRLQERGDLVGALGLLDRVFPEDPAYPFARRLRGQVAEELTRAGAEP